MATEEPIVATEPAPASEEPAADVGKPEKKKNETKAKPRGPRKPSTHPPYFEMITDAIMTLKERNGSSQQAIQKFIEEKHKQLPPNFRKLLLVNLKKSVAAEKLVKIKASYKLPPTRQSSKRTESAAAAPVKKTTRAGKPGIYLSRSSGKRAAPAKKAAAPAKATRTAKLKVQLKKAEKKAPAKAEAVKAKAKPKPAAKAKPKPKAAAPAGKAKAAKPKAKKAEKPKAATKRKAAEKSKEKPAKVVKTAALSTPSKKPAAVAKKAPVRKAPARGAKLPATRASARKAKK